MNRWFISMVSDGKYIYWLTELSGHFFRLNLNNLKAEFIRPLGDYNNYNGAAILCIKDDVIYFVLSSGKLLIAYNIKYNTIHKYDVGCQDMYLNMFSYAEVVKNTLIIIPIYSPYIIYIDLNSGDVDKKQLRKSDPSSFKMYHTNSIISNEMRRVELINVDTAQYSIYNITEEDIKEEEKVSLNISNAVSIEKGRDGIYVLDHENVIYKYDNGSCRKLAKIDDEPDGYFVLHNANDWLWIMPLYGQKIYKYNIKTKIMHEYVDYPNGYSYNALPSMGKFTSKCKVGNLTYFSMHAGTHIFCVDNNTGEGRFLDIQWPDWKESSDEVIYKKFDMLYEKELSLQSYIKYGIKYGFDKFINK